MKKSLFVALVLFSPVAQTRDARANDSSFSAVGGTMKPMKGQHSSVRMESERIVIDAYAERYDTTVDFVFHNTGRKNIATMGFPESNYGDVHDASLKTSFLRFNTSVDGVPFKAKRTVTKDRGVQEFDAYWIKTVPFERGQKRRVRVRYSSPYSGTTMIGFTNAMSYAFTGGNWKDDVKFSDMEIRVHEPGRWLLMSQWSEGEKEATTLAWKRQGNVFRRRWTKWQAEGSVLVGLVPARANWVVSKRMALDTPSSWSRALVQAQEFTVPGRVTHGKNIFGGYSVAGFIENGVTFVPLGDIETAISSSTFDVDKENIPGKVEMEWDAKTKTRTLVAGKRRFGFREGQKTMTVDGKAQSLPAAPFKFNENLYVPAAPVARELGGKVESNLAGRWVEMKFPAVR